MYSDRPYWKESDRLSTTLREWIMDNYLSLLARGLTKRKKVNFFLLKGEANQAELFNTNYHALLLYLGDTSVIN